MAKRRKTIKYSELRHLSCINAKRMPQIVNIDGRRHEWVGIGWIDIGPATGREVKVIDDEEG